MFYYQHPTITSHPLSRAITYKPLIILKFSDCTVSNSWKHLLSSDIEDDQLVTMHCQKQFLAPEPDGLNSESDDN